MKLNRVLFSCLAITGGILAATAQAQTVVDSFEYATVDDLMAAWTPSPNAILDLTNNVASTSTGTKALSITFNFPSVQWATEFVKGTDLSTPVVIGESQYVTMRIKGDPAFASSDFRNFYFYAYDSSGNFGRWGTAAPLKAEWQAFNFSAAGIEKPWDSPALPDMNDIVRFAIFQYGSQAAIPAYTATILLDDLAIRDTPLSDPAPIGESDVELFEYGTTTDLAAAWVPSANAVVTLATDVSSASPGKKCMKVNFNFPSGEWATEFVTGPTLEKSVAVGTNQYVVLRLKGDPAFAAADFRAFFLYAYDESGNFGRWSTTVPTTSDWQIVNFAVKTIEKPWNSPALPDLNRISHFAVYQYGSQAAIPAYSASIELDDILIRDNPVSEVTFKEAVIDDFEYASDDDLLVAWTGSANAFPALSDDVASKSKGSKSMAVTFNFVSIAWATEYFRGSALPAPLAIGPKQYLSFRVKGDPAFATTDFQSLFLYAYDNMGNFGRWGGPVPTDEAWHVVNFQVGSIQKPWDSPSLPDFNNIVRFAFFQYGSETELPEYTATVRVDDLTVRNTALMEFPDPAPFRSTIENFESYANTDALTSFYSYVISPAATVATAEIETPAPQGSKALKLTVDFAAGQYPWGSVKSGTVTPFSFPTNGIVSLRLKGDTALAAKADGGTSFWLSFYDNLGAGINFITDAQPLVSGEWTTIQARLADFGDTSTVDVGNLVQWRLLVQAYEGQAAFEPMSATIHIDDLSLSLAPAEPLTVTATPVGKSLQVTATGVVAGKIYVIYSSADLGTWTAGAQATATTSGATWTLPTTAKAEFFKVAEKVQ